jgi:hypothetical protein
LDGLPEDLSVFLDFYDQREKRMMDKLGALLGVERELAGVVDDNGSESES